MDRLGGGHEGEYIQKIILSTFLLFLLICLKSFRHFSLNISLNMYLYNFLFGVSSSCFPTEMTKFVPIYSNDSPFGFLANFTEKYTMLIFEKYQIAVF